ncbi:unnamed protein product [Schistosoma rodhaini]|nr:unnamed protein product [Schistosoma rodhaini]
MKNSCKRPGCHFAVTSGMQCDNCKGWFHEACTDLTATAYSRLRKFDRRWVCVTCNTDTVVMLGTIITLLTGFRDKLSKNLVNDSIMTGNKAGTHRANKKKDTDRSVIDSVVNSTSGDVLKLSTILTSTPSVNLGPPGNGP